MADPAVKLTKAIEAAHNAPLARIYTDHRGHKFIGVHTYAWARASRALLDALKEEGEGHV